MTEHDNFANVPPSDVEYGYIYDGKHFDAKLTIEKGSEAIVFAKIFFPTIFSAGAEANKNFIPAAMKTLLPPHIASRLEKEAQEHSPETDILLANLFLTTLTNFLNFRDEAVATGKQTSFVYSSSASPVEIEGFTDPEHRGSFTIAVYRSQAGARQEFATIRANNPYESIIKQVVPALMEAMDIYKDRLPKKPGPENDGGARPAP